MITSYYRSPDGRTASQLDEAAMREALATEGGVLWVDLEDVTREGAALLSDVFDFHHLAIDDCFNDLIDPAKIDDYGRYLFIITHAIAYDETAERVEVSELDLFLGRNYVVSFHKAPLHFVEALRWRVEHRGPQLGHSAEFLAHALLDAQVDDYQPAVERLDDRLELIEERVLEQPDSSLLQELLILKRNAQRLRRTIIPQREVVNRIARGEFPEVVRPESHMYYRDIYDHVVRVEELVESVRELADGVLNTYLSSLNNKMNEVMKTLSVVAAIFLPLTLIASIYGMNFENMPELGWEGGYFWVLSMMLLLALGLVAFFRYRRWF